MFEVQRVQNGRKYAKTGPRSLQKSGLKSRHSALIGDFLKGAWPVKLSAFAIRADAHEVSGRLLRALAELPLLHALLLREGLEDPARRLALEPGRTTNL